MRHIRATSVSAPAGTPAAQWLERDSHRRSSWPALVRPLDRIVVEVADATTDDRSRLPEGAATAEATAARAARSGAELVWDPPRELPDAAALVELCRQRGADSVGVVRADPSLLPHLQLGAWCEAGWRTRLLRRAGGSGPAAAVVARLADRGGAETVGLAADLAFWAGVRRAATRDEWRRWTRSYVVLNYHRISDDHKPDQELIEVAPRRFFAQMRMLRRLRFTALGPEEQVAVHDGRMSLPPRAFVVTADDGFLDCTEPLRAAAVRAQLFVPTSDVGGAADSVWHRDHPVPGWGVDGEPLADWERLRDIERDGVLIGGHARRHAALPELPDDELAAALQGSREDLARELAAGIDAMAYPHGLHDSRVRAAARDAGFRLAYTTQFGRNGAGTDPWCLRRVPVFRDDGLPTVLWKVLTGEPPPPALLRAAGKLAAAGRVARRPSRSTIEQTTAGRRLLAKLAGVDGGTAVAIVAALSAQGVDPVVAGGWGVDVLLGRPTRPHLDLDVVVDGGADETAVAEAMAPLGFRLRERVRFDGVAFSRRWVFRDHRGRSVDVLPVGGRAPFTGDWTTTGSLHGHVVTCLSPGAQHAARTGYPWRDEDHQARRLLEQMGAQTP